MTCNQRSLPRVAILGAGMIAHRPVNRWKQVGAEVVAVADINREILQAFADKHGIAHRRTDYHAILEARGAGAVDIVDICTPPWLHASMAINALRAGKHVLCEKPFALSSEDKPSIVTAEHARHVIEIIAVAYRAAATGQMQELKTVGSTQ
jgi:UDP-N-acetyl-2-amino-2-deoxyglucuronate dehydrogenase